MPAWLEALGPRALVTVNVLVSLLASVHVVLHKRNSRAVTGWLGLIWLAPVVGLLAYLVLGMNRIRRTAAELRREAQARGVPARTAPDTVPPGAVEPELQPLERFIAPIALRPMTFGNRVEVLDDGDATYPAMLEAIEAAERSITMLTFIFDAGSVSTRFVDALSRARQRGVQVRVLVDAIGNLYSFPPPFYRLQRLGVRVARFLPTYKLQWFNLRNHRKLLIVDGQLAFTGGLNVRDAHVVALAGAAATRDTHFRVRGPVVPTLQEIFVEDWAFATGEILSGEPWFVPVPEAGQVALRAISDGPDADFETLLWSLLGALACARRSVRILTPYFLPDSELATALGVAAMRGVQVDVVVPRRSNQLLIDWACRAVVQPLIEHGVRVWWQREPFDHGKLMVVDDAWTLFGSANWDARSLRLNFELAIEAYDRDLAAALASRIDARIRNAERVSLATLQGAPTAIRVRDGIARVLMPYL
jgi:cardiolipin synthase